MAEEAKREDEDAKWEREKREKEERDEKEREKKRRARERKKNKKGMESQEGDLAASVGNDKVSNGSVLKGNEKGTRRNLQIARRKGEGGDEEQEEARGSADLEIESLMQATDAVQAEEIGVIIHDDD